MDISQIGVMVEFRLAGFVSGSLASLSQFVGRRQTPKIALWRVLKASAGGIYHRLAKAAQCARQPPQRISRWNLDSDYFRQNLQPLHDP